MKEHKNYLKSDTQSKFLSLLLRHRPGDYGLVLDHQGWTDVVGLVELFAGQFKGFTRDDLFKIVAEDTKTRYSLTQDLTRIRANQGHNKNLDVDPGLVEHIPPQTLFHGTKASVISVILRDGLKPMSRHHVHLSETKITAETVGSRREGETVIIGINAHDMHRSAYTFWKSQNNVWLAKHVPVEFLFLA